MNSTTTIPASQKRVLIGLSVAACIFLAVWLTWSVFVPSFGGVQNGKEFSPYSFNSRHFRINKWSGGTVVQPSALACPLEISKHLTNSTRTSGVERWDLVHYSKSFGQLVDSEASILVNCFEAIDHIEDKVWEKWSKNNPTQAAILWPSVQKLAIHRAYFAIPELLQFAATSPDAQELTDKVDRISRQAAADQVARLVNKKEFSEARMTLEWGKTFGQSSEFDRLEVLVREGFIAMTKAKK